ncbi:MAG: hypothetical protein KC657_12755 [Myxococcales bacterium]|nr:hypothetical protein [Myxococcales bacterium]
MDTLAIISKAQFDGAHRGAAPGSVLAIDRYISRVPALRSLEQGGALFLVTVRPGDVLWLVGVLETPAFDGDMWAGPPNTTPVADITHLRGELRFDSGKGLVAAPGKLGMSLQTPRVLAESDVTLLRAAIGATPPAAPERRPAAQPAKKKAARSTAAPARRPRAKAAAVAAPAEVRRAPQKGAKTNEGTWSPPTLDGLGAWLDPTLPTSPAGGPADLEAQLRSSVDDLDARRVLADALLEAGDPRGMYMQLAVEHDGTPSWDPARERPAQQLASFEARYGMKWSEPLRGVGGLGKLARDETRAQFAFRRGAIELLRGDAQRIVAQLEAAQDVAPICGLELKAVTPAALAALTATRALSRIRRLDLDLSPHQDQTKALAALFASPHLGALTHLGIDDVSDVEEVMTTLATADALGNLRSLSLRLPELDRASVEALGRAPWAASLEELDLRITGDLGELGPLGSLPALARLRVTGERAPEAISALAGRTAGTLRELSIEGGQATPRQLADLGSAAFAGLRVLRLEGIGLNAAKLARALGSWELAELWHLDLGGSALREAGAAALAASPLMATLERLDVGAARLGDAGAAALAKGVAPRLRRISLAHNALGEAGLAALAEGPLLAHVEHVDLRNNKCHNAGGLAFAALPTLPRVKHLALHYNWMGVHGLRAILQRMEDAEELHLDENNYGVEPVRALAASTTIRNLRVLSTREADAKWLAAFASSPAASRLEQLSLSSSALDDASVDALLALPALGSIHLTFCFHLSEPARQRLSARFGPMLTFWPPENGA